MRNLITCFLLISFFSNAQIIQFKIKIEDNTASYYTNLKLNTIITKGDSIFGINPEGFYVSFDKGVNFKRANVKNICTACTELLDDTRNHSEQILFLKGDDIVVFNKLNSKFYIATDWVNFNVINNKTKSDFPSVVQELEKQGYYRLHNVLIADKTFIMAFSGGIGSKEKFFYSKDLSIWKEIIKPNNLNIAGYNGINFNNKSLYLFTWDKKNISIVYSSMDFGIKWTEVKGLHYKYWNGLDDLSLNSIRIFNNKIFYNNSNNNYLYDVKTQLTTPIEQDVNSYSAKLKDDYLYFVSDNKILIYKDSISELNIDYSKFKSIDEALISKDFIVINGQNLLLLKNGGQEIIDKIANKQKETEYVVFKNNENVNITKTNNYSSKNNTVVDEIASQNKEFKLNCFELKQSDKKPTKASADAFMDKAHDSKTKLNSICRSNGYDVEEILYQNLLIGYRIEGNGTVYIFDNKGLLYLHILTERLSGSVYKYTFDYTGMVVSLDIKNDYGDTSHAFKIGLTKEQALAKHKDYKKIRVTSSTNDKSYSSDGYKCTTCRLGRYVNGSCSQCGTVSSERLNESKLKRANCEACNGAGFVNLYNGRRLCTVCKGSGKKTF